MRARGLAATLLTISGVTHVLQLVLHGPTQDALGAALFGVAYFGIGIGLFGSGRRALALGACVPALGAVLALGRYGLTGADPFVLFHVLVDLVVAPICAALWLHGRAAASGPTS
jgi:hypothetical protein